MLFSIHEYITGEKPFFKKDDKFQDDYLDRLLRPSAEDSTELGDVPQRARKGTDASNVKPYGFMYNYSLLREEEREE